MPKLPAADSKRSPCFFRRGAVACLLMLFSWSSLANTLHVTLIPSHDNGAYRRVIDAVVAHIGTQTEAGISLKIANLKAFNENRAEIDRASDLLIPIGIRATDNIIRQAGRTPILATLVLRASFHASLKRRAAEEFTTGERRIGAILLDQPVRRQLHLSRLLFGRVKRIGIPLGPDSRSLRDQIEHFAQYFELPVEIEDIDAADNLMQRLSRLMDRSDVLLALPDPLIFNRRNIRYILLSTYRKRIPVIGFSQSYVKAGALAASYSSPEQIGRQTAEAIIRLRQNPAFELPATLPPKYFSVAINEQVARSFGYTDLSAQNLAERIRRLEQNAQ